MKLYSYFRSSASFRVRVALNLKGLAYDYAPVHLVKEGGEQLKPEYLARNPHGLIPLLEDGPASITQSLAIIEYLEETHPEPALLPKAPADRAYVRGVALSIACEIHPLNNLRVLREVKRLGGEDAKNDWYRHWCKNGLELLEKQLAHDPRVGRCVFGDTPTLADVCLVPQWFNAQRFETDLSGCPTLARIVEHCKGLKAFADAAPGAQPDAE
jgi:maleylpyruvate isomerase